MANPREIDTKEGALRMWAHEALRVFGDRFTSADDLARFRTIVDVSMAKNFEVYLKVIFDGLESPEAGPVFADFLTPPPPPSAPTPADDAQPAYGQIVALDKMRAFVEEEMVDYNATPGQIVMDLVFFRGRWRCDGGTRHRAAFS